jgi:hypothetical protein
MKKSISIILLLVLICSFESMAQWNKPLRMMSKGRVPRDAKLSMGIKAGGLWNVMTNSFVESTNQHGKLGPIGGLCAEWSANPSFSFGLDGLYSIRGTKMNYQTEVLMEIRENGYLFHTFERNYRSSFSNIDIRVPFTYYFTLTKNTIKPYVFVAPGVFYVLQGEIEWTRTDLDEPNVTPIGNKISISPSNMRQFNYCLIGGAGLWLHVNTNNSYYLIKFECAYNYCLYNTFSESEISGKIPIIYGIHAMDFQKLGKRNNHDFEVSASLMFPIKKRLVGACIKWGRYN